jgi:ureidoglycolate lyase
MARIQVPVRLLTRDAFLPFGDVLEVGENRHYGINQGWAERYTGMAKLDLLDEGGTPNIGIVRARARPLPLRVTLMERHPLSTQAFIPLERRPFLVLVAPRGDLVPEKILGFRTTEGQGVNYGRGVWHHPLIALTQRTDFLVVDRNGHDLNCDEQSLDSEEVWVDEF